MSKQKMNRLRDYAKKENLDIDEEMTERLRNSLSDAKINIRVPPEHKEKIMEISERKKFPISVTSKAF